MPEIEAQIRAWTDAVVAESADRVEPVTADEIFGAAERPPSPPHDDGPSAVPPVYVLPAESTDDDARSSHLRRLLVAAGIIVVLALGLVVLIPRGGPVRHLIGPDDPMAAPLAEPEQGLLAITPNPNGSVASGSEIVVTPVGGLEGPDPTTGQMYFVVSNAGVTASWDRWTGERWEQTHVLTAADHGPRSRALEEPTPMPLPLVQRLDELPRQPQTMEGYATPAEPFRFRIPEADPGIYRFCLDGIIRACTQFRISGPDVPELADPDAPVTSGDLEGHPIRRTWRLSDDPSAPRPVADASTVTVYVDPTNCEEGVEQTQDISATFDSASLVPTVDATPERVVITMRADNAPNGLHCGYAGSLQPFTVPLGAPLGARPLIDGGCTSGAGDLPDCAAGDVRWQPGG